LRSSPEFIEHRLTCFHFGAGLDLSEHSHEKSSSARSLNFSDDRTRVKDSSALTSLLDRPMPVPTSVAEKSGLHSRPLPQFATLSRTLLHSRTPVFTKFSFEIHAVQILTMFAAASRLRCESEAFGKWYRDPLLPDRLLWVLPCGPRPGPAVQSRRSIENHKTSHCISFLSEGNGRTPAASQACIASGQFRV
jgi:hypothetical protein